tara:strand:+ start:304 stop:492 length:189 start_codon:yes stop_codon:yes gene_type:complete
MNSSHYRGKPKTKQFERKKIFKGVKGPAIKWEFVDEEAELIPLTRWQKIVAWFRELPIWSIK